MKTNLLRRATYLNKKKLDYLLNSLEEAGKAFGNETLSFALGFMTILSKKAIIKTAIERALRLNLQTREPYIDDMHDGINSIDKTISNLYENRLLSQTIFSMVFDSLSRLKNVWDKQNTSGILIKKLNEIAAVFALSSEEKQLLECIFIICTDSRIDKLNNELSEHMHVQQWCRGRTIYARQVSVFTGIRLNRVQHLLGKSATLSLVGILDKESDLVLEVVDFLNGQGDTPIQTRYYQEYTGASIPLEHHIIVENHFQTIETLKRHRKADQPLNILLYGYPGTGKTEFARSLGRHFKLQVYEVKTLLEKTGNSEEELNPFRYRALTACRNMVDPAHSMIIIDEADTMLNSESRFFAHKGFSTEKGLINKYLDDSRGIEIWITNRSEGIDDSTRRRFDYSIEFDKFSFSQRKTVWERSIRKHCMSNCFLQEDLEKFATDYECSAGGIDIALRNTKPIFQNGGSREKVMPIVESILKAHLKFLGQEKNSQSLLKPNAPEYGIEGLSVKGDLTESLAVINKFNIYWTSGKEDMPVNNMNVLLFGPPGSGKTEMAKHIARSLKRRLIIKKASDLQSMYVGVCEKNIHDAFKEAELDKAILFIDEADSFLYSRESAERSWELSQVNEMLTQMETFKGMLICATNFKKIVDSAAIRRFNIKLEFEYLKGDGSIIFYQRFMERLMGSMPSEAEITALKEIGCLTPGDFKVVYQKHFFFDRSAVSHSRLIEALKEEVMSKNEYTGKKMGFCA